MTYRPISDYGVIGDMHSAALVSGDGSVDWLCWPRFDSPSVFGALLDHGNGGRFQISPPGSFTSHQRYRDDTNILETEFQTPAGHGTLTDFMPVSRDSVVSPHELVRTVRCERGQLELDLWFEPRPGYARTPARLDIQGRMAVANKGQADSLLLIGDAPLSAVNGAAASRFIVREGQTASFVLHWQEDSLADISALRVEESLRETESFWKFVADDWANEGRWPSVIRRSMLALHLLIYAPTGAVCAAATTSLPETVGGVRNWDYRFTWLRDAAFTFDVFHRLRHTGYTRPFIDWMASVVGADGPGHDLHALYSIAPQTNGHSMVELTLDHLEGYGGSRPVRVGNAAYHQAQLDVFGEVLLALDSYQRAGGVFDDNLWLLTEALVEAAARRWHEPDLGIWEFRTEPRHFTFSKLMCWVALDRGLRLACALERPVDFDRWRRVRGEIREAILERGWNARRGCFTQYFGGHSLDASLLFLPMVGFLPGGDPRVGSTIDAIWKDLGVDGLIHRYIPGDADDGLPGEEGTFTMCSLWLAGALAAAGRLEPAEALFERIVSMGNHVGLFSEMLDPRTGDYLGNYPQAFTHIALIHTARNLDRALNGRENGKRVAA